MVCCLLTGQWAHRGADSQWQQDERAAEEDDGPLQPPDLPQQLQPHGKDRHDDSDDEGGGDDDDQGTSLMLVPLLPAHTLPQPFALPSPLSLSSTHLW